MTIMRTTGLALALLTSSFGIQAQELSFTQGGETSTILHKQSTLDNFQIGGNSYFVTSYMESASMVYYLESYADNGTAMIQNKLEIPVGVFNNSYGIDGVVGFGGGVFVLVEHLSKDAAKNTLSIRPVESNGKVSATDTKLMDMSFEKVMNSGYYHSAVSPDRNLLVIAGQLPFVKEQSAKVKLAVYDQSLKAVSQTEITLPGEDTKNKQLEVLVGNDGSVYLIKRTMNKIGEIVLNAYQVDMKAGSVKEYAIELAAPNYVYTYVTTVSPSNELIVAGTYYTRTTVTVGEKKATGIFYFTNKNKSERVMTDFPLDSPVENLTARRILTNGNTVYLAAEQFKEERLDPPASTAGTAASFDYHYNLIHKNEYVIGMDTEGKRKFQLNMAKNFTARDFDHQYTSAYFISGGKFTVVYNDERVKYTTDSGYNSLIPVVVQVTNDGLMQPAVPFIDKLKLPYDQVLLTAKYVQSADDQVNFLLFKNERSKFLKLYIK